MARTDACADGTRTEWHTMPNSVVGVWTLKSFRATNLETGDETDLFGADPRGTLMLHPDGRMVALLTPRVMPTPKTEADRAKAFEKLIAYSGLYRLEPPDRFVTSVDIAWFGPFVGSEQERTYKLDGDKLDIITPPTRIPRQGRQDLFGIGILSWERAAAGRQRSLQKTMDGK